VDAPADLRNPQVTRVMITIVSQNDPPSNPPDVFYYNPPYMRTLMPNTGEATGQVRATLRNSLCTLARICSHHVSHHTPSSLQGGGVTGLAGVCPHVRPAGLPHPWGATSCTTPQGSSTDLPTSPRDAVLRGLSELSSRSCVVRSGTVAEWMCDVTCVLAHASISPSSTHVAYPHASCVVPFPHVCVRMTLPPLGAGVLSQDVVFYPYEGISAQRMRLPLPPDDGYDDDLELISYTLWDLPSNGTLWIEDREGNIICFGRAWLEGRCVRLIYDHDEGNNPPSYATPVIPNNSNYPSLRFRSASRPEMTATPTAAVASQSASPPPHTR